MTIIELTFLILKIALASGLALFLLAIAWNILLLIGSLFIGGIE